MEPGDSVVMSGAIDPLCAQSGAGATWSAGLLTPGDQLRELEDCPAAIETRFLDTASGDWRIEFTDIAYKRTGGPSSRTTTPVHKAAENAWVTVAQPGPLVQNRGPATRKGGGPPERPVTSSFRRAVKRALLTTLDGTQCRC